MLSTRFQRRTNTNSNTSTMEPNRKRDTLKTSANDRRRSWMNQADPFREGFHYRSLVVPQTTSHTFDGIPTVPTIRPRSGGGSKRSRCLDKLINLSIQTQGNRVINRPRSRINAFRLKIQRSFPGLTDGHSI